MVNVHRLAFLFPGQGSQFVGMGKNLYDNTEIGQALFSQADSLLGYPLSRICFEGPEEELKKTRHTQPGLFICSVIVYSLLKERGLKPEVVVGHSLGEYSALYSADVFDFETGLRLVERRAISMTEAIAEQPGTMAAVIGLTRDKVEQICAESSSKGIVVAANMNSEGQIVISGEKDAVEEAIRRAKEAGARRAVQLQVEGAFHSPLMNSAQEKMRRALAAASLRSPEVKFINNADAQIISDPDAIRDSLVRQITSCVRWLDSMKEIARLNVSGLVEVGPGKVLSGLAKRTLTDKDIFNCGTLSEVDKLAEQLR